MIKHNQDGAVSGFLLFFVVLLFIGASSFGFWAYSGKLDYKNNVDSKIKDAVTVAVQKNSTAKDAEHAEQDKNPLRTYNGPAAYGSLQIQFPKTWSGFIDDTGQSNPLVDGYFYPGVVPSTRAEASVFALRVQVTSQTYAATLQSLKSLGGGDQVPPTVTPYALPKVPQTVGVKVTGTIGDKKQGTMIILPLRAQTLQIWSESKLFIPDLENIILPNFVFSP